MIKIAPSILACDFARLGEEAAAMEQAGADMLHLDVMDGHFVPNISFGAPIIASVCRHISIPGDVHLMLTHPLQYIEAFAEAGAAHISFHAESESPIDKTIGRIRSLGMSAGLVLKPDTPTHTLTPYLEQLDMVLVMTVEPGFGGQAFRPELLEKISAVKELALRYKPTLDIQVDGGIDERTAPRVAACGANVLVAGSSLFNQADYHGAVERLRLQAQAGQSR